MPTPLITLQQYLSENMGIDSANLPIEAVVNMLSEQANQQGAKVEVFFYKLVIKSWFKQLVGTSEQPRAELAAYCNAIGIDIGNQVFTRSRSNFCRNLQETLGRTTNLYSELQRKADSTDSNKVSNFISRQHDNLKRYIKFWLDECKQHHQQLMGELMPSVREYLGRNPLVIGYQAAPQSAPFTGGGVACSVTIVFGENATHSQSAFTNKWMNYYGYSSGHAEYKQLVGGKGNQYKKAITNATTTFQDQGLTHFYSAEGKDISLEQLCGNEVHAEDDWMRRYVVSFCQEAVPLLSNCHVNMLSSSVEEQLTTFPQLRVTTSSTPCSPSAPGQGSKFDGCQTLFKQLRGKIAKPTTDGGWGERLGANIPMLSLAHGSYHTGEPGTPLSWIDSDGEFHQEGHAWIAKPRC